MDALDKVALQQLAPQAGVSQQADSVAEPQLDGSLIGEGKDGEVAAREQLVFKTSNLGHEVEL